MCSLKNSCLSTSAYSFPAPPPSSLLSFWYLLFSDIVRKAFKTLGPRLYGSVLRWGIDAHLGGWRPVVDRVIKGWTHLMSRLLPNNGIVAFVCIWDVGTPRVFFIGFPIPQGDKATKELNVSGGKTNASFSCSWIIPSGHSCPLIHQFGVPLGWVYKDVAKVLDLEHHYNFHLKYHKVVSLCL